MKKDVNIQYIHSPDARAFPDDDVANLVEELILSEINTTSSDVRSATASVLKDISRRPTTQMCKFRDQGNTIIAKDGEKTVGMIGLEEHHITTPTGQRLFEIRRNTVLPDYREQGIGRMLRESMIKRVQGIDADALLLSRIHRDNAVNQNLAASTQFRRVTTGDMKKLGIAEEWIEGNEQSGYEFYIFDPRKTEQK